jgi:hypothetical protein
MSQYLKGTNKAIPLAISDVANQLLGKRGDFQALVGGEDGEHVHRFLLARIDELDA